MLKVRVVLLLRGESVAVRAGYPPEECSSDADLAAAKWSWHNNTPAGRGADTLPGAKRLFLPIRTGRGAVGVVGLDSDRSGTAALARPAPAAGRLSDQAALAIERINLAAGCRPRPDRRRDRAAALGLLTSISHDLRTPLASILGAATS